MLNHVVILGLGPSVEQYMTLVKGLGGRSAYADEVWAINSLGEVFDCDRVFHMDDVRIQETRTKPNIQAMLRWLKVHPGPIYTSRPHPDYPGMVAFPFEDVINELPWPYFNSTAAYAVAYAVFLGVRKVSLYGIDFTYPDRHSAERGRACVEFWMGVGMARGVKFSMPKTTSLFDACVPASERIYGYDTVNVHIARDAEGKATVTFTEREKVPTAAEIEARYDHSQHPNPLVGERQVAPSVSGIRRDHVARYEFAARLLPAGSRVVDLACGVGYGTQLLAKAGHSVLGIDRDADAIEYARSHYAHESADYVCADAAAAPIIERVDAAVSFETIEHIEDPRPMLRVLREASPRLIASVPNETVFPWDNHAFHFRHYRKREFEALLAECGWKVTAWYGQEGPESEVEQNMLGRTLIAVAERTEKGEA